MARRNAGYKYLEDDGSTYRMVNVLPGAIKGVRLPKHIQLGARVSFWQPAVRVHREDGEIFWCSARYDGEPLSTGVIVGCRTVYSGKYYPARGGGFFSEAAPAEFHTHMGHRMVLVATNLRSKPFLVPVGAVRPA